MNNKIKESLENAICELEDASTKVDQLTHQLSHIAGEVLEIKEALEESIKIDMERDNLKYLTCGCVDGDQIDYYYDFENKTIIMDNQNHIGHISFKLETNPTIQNIHLQEIIEKMWKELSEQR